jgi:hypothetical protein
MSRCFPFLAIALSFGLASPSFAQVPSDPVPVQTDRMNSGGFCVGGIAFCYSDFAPSDPAFAAWRKDLPGCGNISLDDPALPYLNWRERDHLFVEPPSGDWLPQTVATAARQGVPLKTAGLMPTLRAGPSGRLILEFENWPASANPAEDRLLQGLDPGIAFVF